MKRINAKQLAQLLLDNPSKELARKVAAYISSPSVKVRVNDVTRSLEELSAQNGHVVAHVATAHDESMVKADVVKAVKDHTNAKTVEIVLVNDPDMIGGCTIKTPGLSIDTSITNQLRSL